MIDMKKPIAPAEHRLLALVAHTALYEMLNGTARVEEWRDLADAVNVTEALCDMGRLPPTPVMHKVQGAIDGLRWAVNLPTGRMRMPPAEAIQLKHVIGIYDQALERFSRGTIKDAHDLVLRKVRLARAMENDGVVIVDPHG